MNFQIKTLKSKQIVDCEYFMHGDMKKYDTTPEADVISTRKISVLEKAKDKREYLANIYFLSTCSLQHILYTGFLLFFRCVFDYAETRKN